MSHPPTLLHVAINTGRQKIGDCCGTMASFLKTKEPLEYRQLLSVVSHSSGLHKASFLIVRVDARDNSFFVPAQFQW